MKQSAVRTLGVAALGAAFAAVGTGAASAATALPLDAAAGALPVSTTVLDNVTRTLPVENTAGKVLGGEATDVAAPVTSLLGGLPTKDLPAKGLSLNGLPLGG
ncbi:hypothetical protein [uncultured Streptomyces sp.]|uniref:hypothetical protein n=1 Tax=uncultured Streptomyces sp. TaxID=174707 RepID=UPI00262E47AC|nr:hypothetical protein [uncultured Streptomyces sp.]